MEGAECSCRNSAPSCRPHRRAGAASERAFWRWCRSATAARSELLLCLRPAALWAVAFSAAVGPPWSVSSFDCADGRSACAIWSASWASASSDEASTVPLVTRSPSLTLIESTTQVPVLVAPDESSRWGSGRGHARSRGRTWHARQRIPSRRPALSTSVRVACAVRYWELRRCPSAGRARHRRLRRAPPTRRATTTRIRRRMATSLWRMARRYGAPHVAGIEVRVSPRWARFVRVF